MALTLFEKLDESSHQVTLQESICLQVQRIISTRTYLGLPPTQGCYVAGFGVPEIVDEYAKNTDNHQQYRQLIRQQILALEPRLQDVEVMAITTQAEAANCRLRLKLKEFEIEDQFYF